VDVDVDSGSRRPQKRDVQLRVPRPVYRALRAIAHFVNRVYWRVAVEGSEIPAAGGVILAPVHRSFIDFFVVSEVTRRDLFFMTKEEMWHSRVLGRILDATGAFPVHRQGTDRLALDRAQALLERGEVLVMFPEGTRREGSVVENLEEGVAFLAARSGAAVVPLGVGGTTASLPRGAKVPRPKKVHVVVGEVLVAERRPGGRRTPRREVRELSARLCSALQSVYDVARSRS
jgi:1-acyl-sn-glycerol-3-phosphate acyltransferase